MESTKAQIDAVALQAAKADEESKAVLEKLRALNEEIDAIMARKKEADVSCFAFVVHLCGLSTAIPSGSRSFTTISPF